MPSKGQLTGYFVRCENCGIEVYKTRSQYNKAKHHFCSTKCQKEFEHKEKYEDRKCEICGKSYHVSKKSTQRFCSTECQKIWQTKQVGILNPKFARKEIKCEYCGKEYLVRNYKFKSSEHKFCSNKCRQAWYAEVFSQNEKLERRIKKASCSNFGK